MELQINREGPFLALDTPHKGWRGSVTGLYLHNDDIPWYKAPIPRRWHRCNPQSVGVLGTGFIRTVILRCRCGSLLRGHLLWAWEPGLHLIWDRKDNQWQQRNSRRKNTSSFATLM